MPLPVLRALFRSLGLGAGRASHPSRPVNDYSPELIPELEGDHELLRRQVAGLRAACEDGDARAVGALFPSFAQALRHHLLRENHCLYGYLRTSLRDDVESSLLLTAMNLEMRRVGRELNRFTGTYASVLWDSATLPQFRADLDVVAPLLLLRIEQEETALYPLYQSTRGMR